MPLRTGPPPPQGKKNVLRLQVWTLADCEQRAAAPGAAARHRSRTRVSMGFFAFSWGFWRSDVSSTKKMRLDKVQLI